MRKVTCTIQEMLDAAQALQEGQFQCFIFAGSVSREEREDFSSQIKRLSQALGKDIEYEVIDDYVKIYRP